MSEKTGNKQKRKPLPGPHYLIDPKAFIVALVGAPIVVTVLSFWLFVPIVALILGGPIYLLTATPVMLWYLGRFRPGFLGPAALGLACNLIVATILSAARQAGVDIASDDLIDMYFTFGSIFAPVWVGVFGLLYRSLSRPAFARPTLA